MIGANGMREVMVRYELLDSAKVILAPHEYYSFWKVEKSNLNRKSVESITHSKYLRAML